MKLYELTRGDHFVLKENARVPPGAPEGSQDIVYRFSHIDGMYSYITDPRGDVHHFAAWTEVEVV